MAEIRPEILAMITCRNLTRSADGSEVSLHQVLWAMAVDQFPFRVEQMFIYIAMTGLHGLTTVDLRISLDDNELRSGGLTINVDNPLAFVEHRVDLAGLTLPKPGLYVFDLQWRGEILRTRKLAVDHPSKLNTG